MLHVTRLIVSEERTSKGSGYGEHPGTQQFHTESGRQTRSRGQAAGVGGGHRHLGVFVVDVEQKECSLGVRIIVDICGR